MDGYGWMADCVDGWCIDGFVTSWLTRCVGGV